MITQFRVKNYKALRDVELNLTPIHVLIGPNDAGKTSLLEAIGALCRSVDRRLNAAFIGRWNGRDLVWSGGGAGDETVELSTTIDGGKLEESVYTLGCVFRKGSQDVTVGTEVIRGTPREGVHVERDFGKGDSRSAVYRHCHNGLRVGNSDALCRALHDQLAGARIHRWIPELLSLPVAAYKRERFGLESSGFGLALCLDDILGEDRPRFDDLEDRFRKVFPEIQRIILRPEPAFKAASDAHVGVPFLTPHEGKGVHFKLTMGETIPASHASDGILLILAYLAILKSPNPPRVLLVEEPENGVHPKRLQEVLSILRELVKEEDRTQVILTTHSPYVLDLFEPKEVTLCTKGKDGAVSVRRLSESKTVREQIKVFTLGEIWTAEGDEALATPHKGEKEVAP